MTTKSAIPNSRSTSPRRWPHRLAVLLVCATFPLIWVGGMVTTYDAGMAVPDWPSTYGYNMFLYPWQTWLLGPFDLFIEHGHRLLGAGVGMITIALLVVTVWCDSRKWVQGMAGAALALVIFQGVLGGLRVIGNDVSLARLHGIVGPAFFSLCVALAVVTSRVWQSGATAARAGSARQPAAGKLRRLALLTSALVLVQLIVGAHLRHLPPDLSPQSFRAFVFFHLILAAALVVHIVLLAIRVAMRHRASRALFYPAMLLVGLIAAQIALGGGTWVVNYSWPDWATRWGLGIGHTISAGSYGQALIVTAHQAMGSLILGISVMLTLRSFRLLRSPARRRDAHASAITLKEMPA